MDKSIAYTTTTPFRSKEKKSRLQGANIAQHQHTHGPVQVQSNTYLFRSVGELGADNHA
jgi:hypothetical protein